MCLYRQRFREKGFDETGTVVPVVVFLIHETLGDIPHEMPERNVVDVFSKWVRYGLGSICMKIHPLIHLSTDMVYGFLVGNAGQVEVTILHDHADAFFLFPLFSVCIIGTVLRM